MFSATNPLTLKVSKDTAAESKTEEEQFLEQDIEDKSNKKRRQQLRLNYDDDSSDDEYDSKKDNEVESTRKDEDGDDDMFADDDDDEDNNGEIRSDKIDKKEVKLLDINGFNRENELADNGNGEDDEEVLDEDDDDEDNLEREKKDTLLYYNNPEVYDEKEGRRYVPKVEPKIDAFNLREETNSGQFDEDGNYMRNGAGSDEEDGSLKDAADPLQKDAWYSEFGKKSEIEKTRAAQQKRDDLLRQSKKQKQTRLTEELLEAMILYLDPAETPMEKLVALNKKQKANKNKKSKKQSREAKEKQDEDHEIRKKAIEEITMLASELMSKGRSNIYDESREELMRAYKLETGQDFKRAKESTSPADELENTKKRKHEEVEYEFIYVGDEQIHGPYSKEQILEWKESYFEADSVMVREKGETEFTLLNSFEFD